MSSEMHIFSTAATILASTYPSRKNVLVAAAMISLRREGR